MRTSLSCSLLLALLSLASGCGSEPLVELPPASVTEDATGGGVALTPAPGADGSAALRGALDREQIALPEASESAHPLRVARAGWQGKVAAKIQGKVSAPVIACKEADRRCGDSKAQRCEQGRWVDADDCGARGLACGSGACRQVEQVSAGKAHSCAVLSDETVRCWGANDRGQLGADVGERSPRPAQVEGLAGVADVVTGDAHSCALTHGGAIFCWGDNAHGQLGRAGAGGHEPVRVLEGEASVAITAGARHTCALRQDGVVRCWGDNAFGQLGDKTFSPGLSTTVGIEGILSIAAGEAHTCAINNQGKAFCWGNGLSGQLGLGELGLKLPYPTTVAQMKGAKALAAGASHTCAFINAEQPVCWGDGSSMQLGQGEAKSAKAPVEASDLPSDGVVLSAGEGFTCMLTMGKQVVCHGRNDRGQLGRGHAGAPEAGAWPVPLVGGKISNLDVGKAHACVALDDGGAACWGAGTDGQIGDGDTSDRLAPARVRWLVARQRRSPVIPSFFIFDCSVVGRSPSLAAAPPGP